MNDTALILIDIQNDYFPQGLMELDGSTAARALEYEGRLIPASDVQGSFIAALGLGYARIMDTDAYLN